MRLARTLLTFLAVLAPIFWLAHVYPALPAVIPNHYDSRGVPHRFAGKSIVWMLAATSIGLALMVQIVSRIPHSFNLPVPVDDPRRPLFEAIGVDLLSGISLEIALTFDLLIYSSVQTAMHHTSPYGDALLLLPILVIGGTAAGYIILLRGATLPTDLSQGWSD